VNLWDEFAANYLWNKSQEAGCEHGYHDMITTPTLLIQAFNSFMKKREGE